MPETRSARRLLPVAAGESQPERLTLEQLADGRLSARIGNQTRIVHVRRCFPWSAPAHFVSLRDDDGVEFALVTNPAELDQTTRQLLETALADAGFVFEVQAVLELKEEVELRNWRVQTEQGTRRFQTRLDDWPRELPDGSLLIHDVSGDFYRIGHPRGLDRESRALLWAFID